MAKNTTKPRKLKRPLLLLFFASLVVLFVVIYVLPTVTGALMPTSFVEYGSIKTTDEITGYAVRTEKVSYAKGSGEIQYYFDEGIFLRKGTRVLQVGANNGYTATDNAVVSYYLDGLEETFTPETMSSLKKADVEALEISVQDTKRQKAVKGEPIYKLVDNTQWYLVFWVEDEAVVKYEQGSTVYLSLEDTEIKGRIKELREDEESWYIILEFDRYYEKFAQIRKIDATVITSRYEGLIIANECITAKDGKTGVYVKDINGEYQFTRVSVMKSDGEYSLVESGTFEDELDEGTETVKTVDAYDEILNHPERGE